MLICTNYSPLYYRYLIPLVLCLMFQNSGKAQDQSKNHLYSRFFTTELNAGITSPSNYRFPETDLQKSLYLSLGSTNADNEDEWAYRLNRPKTGVSLGVIDLGNPEALGYGISVLPFAEFQLLPETFKDLNVQVGTGASYFTETYDLETNKYNRAISTHLNWNFKLFMYYGLTPKSKVNWRLGLGYIHNSNGHTRLPNQGLNSFMGGISAQLNYTTIDESQKQKDSSSFKRSTYNYLNAETGLGIRVLAPLFNTQKPVYNLNIAYGKVINNTFKIGVGAYYRYYKDYQDFIESDNKLTQENYPEFKNNPYGYATNLGVFGSGELLMNHVGFEVNVGLNIYKPFYALDYRINKSYSYIIQYDEPPTELAYKNLDWYYEFKRTVSARMGLKYYFWSTAKPRRNNVYLGGHINANLGQADFTEISLGYVYNFNFK